LLIPKIKTIKYLKKYLSSNISHFVALCFKGVPVRKYRAINTIRSNLGYKVHIEKKES